MSIVGSTDRRLRMEGVLPALLEDQPGGLWFFDQNTGEDGTPVADQSGHGAHGVIAAAWDGSTPTVGLAPGVHRSRRTGAAYNLHTTRPASHDKGHRVDLGAFARQFGHMIPLTELTCEVFCAVDSTLYAGPVIDFHRFGGDLEGVGFGIRGGAWLMEVSDGSTPAVASSQTGFEAGARHHHAATWTSGEGFRFFLDGHADGFTAETSIGAIDTFYDRNWLLHRTINGYEWPRGRFYFIAIYGSALSAERIALHAAACHQGRL